MEIRTGIYEVTWLNHLVRFDTKQQLAWFIEKRSGTEELANPWPVWVELFNNQYFKLCIDEELRLDEGI